MTDRELLELAAKAAGLSEGIGGAFWTNDGGVFDPLTDDGDAFRLAVKLDLCIGFDKDPIEHVVFIRKFDTPILEEASIFEHIKGDPYAATRRAIVRAAAAIGKELK